MSSTTTLYSKDHSEWLEQERVKDRAHFNKLYQDNSEYQEKVKQRALARYYRLKTQKSSTTPIS